MKIYIEYSSFEYQQMFSRKGWTVVDNYEDADIVCFTGGADVSPHLYGDGVHVTTYSNAKRDVVESLLYANCIDLNIPMIGICRGAQFLNVMNGGRMYQNVTKHGGAHAITDLQTGEVLLVSSTHHQMMMPSPEAILVASSTLGGSREWFDGQIARKDVSEEDIEVVLYPKTQCLCFQPHPEFTAPIYNNMTTYFFSCIERYLIEEDVTA